MDNGFDLTHLCNESDENLSKVLIIKNSLISSGFRHILTGKQTGLDMYPGFVSATKYYDCFVIIPKVTELDTEYSEHFKRKYVTGILTNSNLVEVYALPKK